MGQTTILAAEGGSGFSLLVPAIPDLIWGTVAFLIVAIGVYKFAWPSFSAMLDERGEKIEEGLKAAETARAEVAAERAELEAAVNDAHREAAEIRAKAQENAKEIVADAQVKARAESESIVGEAQRRIAAETDAAARSLRSDVGSLATQLAGRIVGEQVTDDAVAKRVIDRFLDDLEASVPATPVREA